MEGDDRLPVRRLEAQRRAVRHRCATIQRPQDKQLRHMPAIADPLIKEGAEPGYPERRQRRVVEAARPFEVAAGEAGVGEDAHRWRALFVFGQREAELHHHLIALDLLVLALAAQLGHFESAQLVDRLGSARDSPGDRILNAVVGSADDLDDLGDVIHARSLWMSVPPRSGP